MNFFINGLNVYGSPEDWDMTEQVLRKRVISNDGIRGDKLTYPFPYFLVKINRQKASSYRMQRLLIFQPPIKTQMFFPYSLGPARGCRIGSETIYKLDKDKL